jgi:hypothetical protein
LNSGFKKEDEEAVRVESAPNIQFVICYINTAHHIKSTPLALVTGCATAPLTRFYYQLHKRTHCPARDTVKDTVQYSTQSRQYHSSETRTGMSM